MDAQFSSQQSVRLITKEKGTEWCWLVDEKCMVSFTVFCATHSMNDSSRICLYFGWTCTERSLSLKHVILFYLFIFNQSRGLGQKSFSCPQNSVYWRKDMLRLHTLHRPTFTAERSAQMWIGGKRPHHSYPPARQSSFSFSPVDPATICLLAVSSRWGGGHGYWPIICSPHESSTAAKTIFFISQCPQPKLATQLPPVISNKLYWLGPRVP